MMCVRPDCHRLALRLIGGVPLCLEDIQAVAAGLDKPTPLLLPDGGRTEPTTQPEPITDYKGISLVYYMIREGQPYIKIGVSQNVHMRMKSISTLRRPAHLLAVEPGGYYLEKVRHRQFRHLRDPGSEWFRDSPEIRDHIADLTLAHGPASCTCPNAPIRCALSIRKKDRSPTLYRFDPTPPAI